MILVVGWPVVNSLYLPPCNYFDCGTCLPSWIPRSFTRSDHLVYELGLKGINKKHLPLRSRLLASNVAGTRAPHHGPVLLSLHYPLRLP
jgi:hypothetical protein